jgi:nitrite reductase/ring-hydroxylating ferredoxin subunit
MERRAFMRAALSIVGALSLSASRAGAMSVTFLRGEQRGEEKAYPIPAADGVTIDRDESVIVANVNGRAYAFSLACPHQNTALRWDADEHRYKCPKHHSRYQADGSFIDGRATRGMDRFAVRRDGAQLFVNLELLYRQDENAAEWASAFVSLT